MHFIREVERLSPKAGIAGEAFRQEHICRRAILDIQGPTTLFGFANPFYYNPYWGFFLQMLPYAFTIIVLIIGSRQALRRRLGAPAALGLPYVRGERGA